MNICFIFNLCILPHSEKSKKSKKKKKKSKKKKKYSGSESESSSSSSESGKLWANSMFFSASLGPPLAAVLSEYWPGHRNMRF